ncbi:MAG: hypothetical protein JSS49_07385 [Planctomycetes bacterium]|nr:hypothetical protein [Planctomycetota bacterium]
MGFQLPTHAARQIRKGQHYDFDRSAMEARLQKTLGGRLSPMDQDGVTQYESRAGKFVLQISGNRSGIERATLRLHRSNTLSEKQRTAREREIKIIAQVLLMGDDGTKWVCEAACGSVATATREATEVHQFGKANYILKAFEHADAEIDDEPTNPRLWITIGPHIEFEKPEPVPAK